MALWGKTDTLADAPKWLETAAANPNKSNDMDNAVFVDLTEAGIAANRAKGLTGPGWWLYHTSNGRHYAECLVPMKVSAGDAGDAGVTGNTAFEDLTVADA